MAIYAHVLKDIPEIIVRTMYVTQNHVRVIESADQILNTIVGTTAYVTMDFLGKTVRSVQIELLLMNNMTSLLHHPVAPPTTTTTSAESVHIEAGPTPIYQQPTVWAISIFIVILVICVLAYVGYHNRNKVWPFFTFL